MNIEILWNDVKLNETDRSEVQENLTKEIVDSISHFNISCKSVVASLYFDQETTSLVGVVSAEKKPVITLTYSLNDKHAAIYTKA